MANERARGLGYKFVTDDKYLVNPFSPTEGISYEGDGSPVSYANSGIMAQAPIIYPPINQGGGDDGGGFTGPTGPGSYDSAFDPETQNKQFNEDIGVGTVAEEDDEKGTSLGIVDALRAMGAFTFGGPLNAGYSLKRSVDRNKQKELDKINAEIAAQDAKYGISDARLTAGGATQETMDSYENSDGSYSGASTEDYGGGEKDGGFIDGSNRRPFNSGGRAGYFFGGRVNYKAGGRIGFQGGGMNQGNEENQKQSAEMGNTTVSNNNDSGNDNPPNFFVEDKTSVVDTSGLKSKSPEININYTDPKNYASLKSRVYNTNILDNDDLNVDGTLSGEIGPVSYNTNFTDQGITGTDLTAGNFNASIDANKNYNIGYANNYNGIDYGTTYDSNGNLMFNAGVKFKNGGLASIL